ncbi:MAG: SEC-C domain-containing protein [Notoacmeibacter sp.]|nr:SEC-C domain-containing protein [Notoacmeibacter sp.]
MVLCETDEMLDLLELGPEEVGQTVDEAIEILPDTVIAIADYWNMAASQRDTLADGLRIATRIGRNDPCPSGSGHKFKKCCGAHT